MANIAELDVKFISRQGGLNTFVEAFERGITNRGHKLIEFSPYREGRYAQKDKEIIPVEEDFDYQINSYCPVLNLGSFNTLTEISEKIVNRVESMQNRIDIFNGTDWPCGLIFQKIKERKESGRIRQGLKTLAVIHNGYYQGICPEKKVKLLEILINNADEIATVGESFGREWNNYDFHPKIPQGKKLHLLPNGLNVDIGNNIPLVDKFVTSKDILFFSRPTEEKGLEALYKALPSMSEYLEVRIVGVDYSERYESFLKRGCKKEPSFYGWHNDRKYVNEELDRAVAVVSPSGYTPFELCPREGILRGAFPIITNIGSHKDGFKDISQIGGNCIMINCDGLKGEFWKRPRDVLELGTRIADATKRFYDLLQSPEGTRRMQHGIDSTIEQYKNGKLWSMDKCVENYEKLYTQMLSE